MEESLKSARNIHQLIIVISTIIGVFAFSIEQELNRYDIALERVEKLQNAINELRISGKNSKLLAGNGNEYALDSNRIKFLDNARDIYPMERIDKALQYRPRAGVHDNYAARPIAILLKEKYFADDKFVSTEQYLDNQLMGKSIWNLIKNKNIEEAKEVLEKYSANFNVKSRSDIDLSGIKVAGQIMYILGPTVILMLLIYLTTLVRHVIRTSEGDIDEISHFPWLSIFPDLKSQLISGVSLTAYPIAACLTVICRSNVEPSFITISFVVTSILLFFATLVLQRRITKLQKIVFGGEFVPLSQYLKGKLFKPTIPISSSTEAHLPQ